MLTSSLYQNKLDVNLKSMIMLLWILLVEYL